MGTISTHAHGCGTCFGQQLFLQGTIHVRFDFLRLRQGVCRTLQPPSMQGYPRRSVKARRRDVLLTLPAVSVQIALLGVSVGAPGGEVTLQPLHYRVPTDGVIMTTVASTEAGRIFLGGGDGHLYELKYTLAGLQKVHPRYALLCMP